MARSAVILLLMFFSFQVLGQVHKTGLHFSDSTSNILRRVGYFWRIDSLANNGFRLYAYESLLKSKVDSVAASYIFEQLGKPNEVIKTNKGVDYLYYYYDSKKVPKEICGEAFECLYIAFFFKNGARFLSSMYTSEIDY